MTADPVTGVDARHAQNRHPAAKGRAEAAQQALGIDPPARPVAARRHRARLVEARTAAVTVDARGAGIDQMRRLGAPRQRAQEIQGAQVALTMARRRRQMQDGIGPAGQTRQRRRFIQIAQHRLGARRAQLGKSLRAGAQRPHLPATGQQAQHPHADIATTHDQKPRSTQTARRVAELGRGQRRQAEGHRIRLRQNGGTVYGPAFPGRICFLARRPLCIPQLLFLLHPT